MKKLLSFFALLTLVMLCSACAHSETTRRAAPLPAGHYRYLASYAAAKSQPALSGGPSASAGAATTATPHATTTNNNQGTNQYTPNNSTDSEGKSTLPIGTCILKVPGDPLSAQGLATPWKLVGCKESDPNAAVFVQGMIFDPVSGALSVYSPLVIDAGSTPAVTPIMPKLPAHAVVAVWGGGNDTATILQGDGANACTSNRVQVFFCGAAHFFAAVNASGLVHPPALGIASDGRSCPTTRSFSVVDQDQSDNVQTLYLALPNGQTAQDTAANRALFPGASVMHNGSDNLVLTNFLDPALGCAPWLAPDLADPGALVPAQALDELQAAAFQAAPSALVPSNDPMVMVGGQHSLRQINRYRAGVDQPRATGLSDASTRAYCRNLVRIAPDRLLTDKQLFLGQPSPVPAIGDSLYTFLAARLQFTLNGPVGTGLNCTGLLGITNPVTVVLNAAGVAVQATIYGK